MTRSPTCLEGVAVVTPVSSDILSDILHEIEDRVLVDTLPVTSIVARTNTPTAVPLLGGTKDGLGEPEAMAEAFAALHGGI